MKPGGILSNNISKYWVKRSDLARNRGKVALSKISSDARSGANEKMGGFGTCQPSAPGLGIKCGSSCMRKRVAGSLPHHPAIRGNDTLLPCFSCTKQPPTAPGPEFRYL